MSHDVIITMSHLVERVEFHELRAGKSSSMDKDDLGHQVRYCTLVFKDSSSLGPALQLDGQVGLIYMSQKL